jgi:hypothetical protein
MNYLNFHTGRPRFHFEEGSAGGADGAAAAAAASAAAAAASAAKPWHEGIDVEFIGHANNKGWNLDSPKEAFAAAAKVARDLEKHFGAPPDQILRMPKPDATPAEKAAFRQRLGWPAEAKDYDFSTVKDAAGQPIAQPLADALRASFHANGIAKDAAPAVALDVIKALDSVKTTQSTVTEAQRAEDRGKLEKNWGGKESNTYRFNLLAAKEGANRLGIDEAGVAALEGMMGYSSVMDALRKIGNARKEDVFIESGPSGANGKVTTREGAMSRKQELFADQAWVKRLNAGDQEAKTEWKRLNQMIDGE